MPEAGLETAHVVLANRDAMRLEVIMYFEAPRAAIYSSSIPKI